MATHDDDIGGLFKAIGGKHHQFKEFSNQNEAAKAQERWPLFKTIGVDARPVPPQLLPAEKQAWEARPEPAPLPKATKSSGLSSKIASGLTKLGHARAETSPASDEPAHHLPAIAHHAAPPPALKRSILPGKAPLADAPANKAHQLKALFAPAEEDMPEAPPVKARTSRKTPAKATQDDASGSAFVKPSAKTSAKAGTRTSASTAGKTRTPASLLPKSAKPLTADHSPSAKPGLFQKRANSDTAHGHGATKHGLFANKSSREATSEPVHKLFASKPRPAPAGKPSLFGKQASNASANDDHLSNLFARLDEPAPPGPGKPRALFNRMGKP